MAKTSRENLANLPAHIHLQIIYHTFPNSKPQLPTYSAPTPAPDDDGYLYTSSPSASSSPYYNPNSNYYPSSSYPYDYGRGHGYGATRDTIAERQRRTLRWLLTSLRLVNRSIYIACMHVLRSSYLQAYLEMVKAPYTSDPFPMGVSLSSRSTSASSGAGLPAYPSSVPSTTTRPPRSQKSTSSPLKSPNREPSILDRFIALKIRSDVLLDESSLHLSRDDAFRDLFDVEQPRARLEDLVREEGVRRGIICVPRAEYGGFGYGDDDRDDEIEWENANEGLGRAKPLGMSNPSGSISSSSLRILREVDKQIEAHRAYLASGAQAQTQSHNQNQNQTQVQTKTLEQGRGVKRGFFSFLTGSQPTPPPPRTWHSPQADESTPKPPSLRPIPFHFLSVSFAPRNVRLVLSRTRTIAEVPRNHGGTLGRGAAGGRETLEVLARRIVDVLGREMGGW